MVVRWAVVVTMIGCAVMAGDRTACAERIAWTTSRVVGTPDPPPRYVATRELAALEFREPIEIDRVPGTDRMIVIEREGKIWTFAPGLESQDARCALDLAADLRADIDGLRQIYGFAFHPDFQRNRQCYVCYVLSDGLEDGTRVARFTMTSDTAPRIDASSQRIVLTWLSGGHNGGCLRFGPDGCLYIATGDGVGPNPPDTLRTGQDCSDLLSSILRINVDGLDDSDAAGYRVPADNPLVNHTGLRSEIWAYGFRNPWKMTFDPATGDLWAGDVGWELWELVFRVERGGNYGWSVMEGRQPTNPEWPRGPTPILPPTVDHPHTEAASLTMGHVYQGSRHEELRGALIYGDFETGKIWSLRYQEGRTDGPVELADTSLRIIAFGLDHDGELHVVDYYGGGLYRLERNEQPQDDAAKTKMNMFPRELSAAGIFADVAAQSPNPGVVPFQPAATAWADGVTSEYWIGIPSDEGASAASSDQPSAFPPGTVLVKTLSLPPDADVARRRIETQLLHLHGQEWRAYVYAWSADQRDAQLVPAEGATVSIDIGGGDKVKDARQIAWRHASRAECMRCHNRAAGTLLAMTRDQLSREQQSRLHELRVLNSAPSERPNRSMLVSPTDREANLERRARSYLHVNCGHCHRDNGGSAAILKLHHDVALDRANLLKVRPSLGTFGIAGAELIPPGDAARSVVLYRMAKLGGGHMPHLGSREVDVDGVRLVWDWIDQMELSEQGAEGSESQAVGRLREDDQLRIERLRRATAPLDATMIADVDALLSTTSGAMRLLRAIDTAEANSSWVSAALERAHQHPESTTRELFERFLPRELRPQRLEADFDHHRVLSLPGDAQRGRAIFMSNQSVRCAACHRLGGEGADVGPDLTGISKKYDRAGLLQQIVDPSLRMDPAYVTYLVETTDGMVWTGLLRAQDDSGVTLQTADGKSHHFATSDIEQMVGQGRSLMPDGVVNQLTAEQLADLLAFLQRGDPAAGGSRATPSAETP